MPQRKAVIMLSSAAEMSSAVTAALQGGTQFELVGVVDDLAALKSRLDRGDIQAALIDVDNQPDQLLSGLTSATARFPEVRFIILSSNMRQDLLIEAMQAGARNVIDRQTVETKLDAVLRRIVPDATARVAGQITTLLSASGGCGATTLALNLANELQILTGQPSLLVDMDLHYGAVAIWLGLKGQFGLGDVLAFGEGIDAHLIRSATQTAGTNLHVLLSPAGTAATTATTGTAGASGARNPLINFDHLDETLDAFRYSFTNTVIDAPRVPAPVAARLSMASGMTLIAMQLTVRDIHIARNLVTDLTGEGVQPDQIFLLVNRHCKRSLITLDEARQALNNLPMICISNDYRNAAKAMNHGHLLASVAASSPLRRDLVQLAGGIRNSTMQTIANRGKR